MNQFIVNNVGVIVNPNKEKYHLNKIKLFIEIKTGYFDDYG